MLALDRSNVSEGSGSLFKIVLTAAWAAQCTEHQPAQGGEHEPTDRNVVLVATIEMRRDEADIHRPERQAQAERSQSESARPRCSLVRCFGDDSLLEPQPQVSYSVFKYSTNSSFCASGKAVPYSCPAFE